MLKKKQNKHDTKAFTSSFDLIFNTNEIIVKDLSVEKSF